MHKKHPRHKQPFLTLQHLSTSIFIDFTLFFIKIQDDGWQPFWLSTKTHTTSLRSEISFKQRKNMKNERNLVVIAKKRFVLDTTRVASFPITPLTLTFELRTCDPILTVCLKGVARSLHNLC